MSLIKWNSNDLFPSIDSIWDNFFNRDFLSKGLDLGTKVPAVNTKETDGSFQVEVAVPGMKKEDFKIDLDNNILTISSEKKEEKDEKDGEKISRREFSYFSFQRSFHLPNNVKEEEISAEYADGLLKLTIPKTETKKIENKKQIEIK
ncbi:MAG: Hsp20/alpha crystallin family protein [Pelagibacteraceae bacterium]|jgi:HSP20 family protein|nr:Hsp20/alpha crystallin family protein [Cryomorphaceae bacterium]MBT4958729.1 Hsp20/alpha crystallin family protein [Flavobacteriaceae bacterium]MBT5214099.1 Hsp20/alpha crystallin family protein [Pelagibacteraceae bacterium]MBT6198565.1 Hsp20/alpha crystallin family protein [Pelagibacteraceae bacterium]MBT6448492.1 Hsp20/alpha crystallin family protein [Flavobacteriaceae bacterium]